MIGHVVHAYESVTSTQDVAFRLAERGATHGEVVVANHQTSGRGRADRVWVDEPGRSLLMSVIVRPRLSLSQCGAMSLLVADALIDVIERDGATAAFKWPNDVMVDGRKLGGILLQTRSTPVPVVVIGIGVNLTAASSGLPKTAIDLTSATGRPVDRDEVMARVCASLDRRIAGFGGMLDVLSLRRLQDRMCHRDEVVSICDGDRTIRGIATEIDVGGGLVLETGAGRRVIVSGELTRGPRLDDWP